MPLVQVTGLFTICINTTGCGYFDTQDEFVDVQRQVCRWTEWGKQEETLHSHGTRWQSAHCILGKIISQL